MNKKNRKKLIDPEISPQQIELLNKEFYEKYYGDYFSTKLFVLGSMLSNTDKFTQTINENDINVGKYKVESEQINGETSDLIKYAKLELSVLYYHCIETFLRLFLAHVCIKPCPWLELSRDTNPKNFKDKIKSLSEGKFNFHYNNWTSDELITYIFYGTKDVESIQGLDNYLTLPQIALYLKNWIIWCSKEILSVYDYNSFKHGMSVYSEFRGIKLGDSNGTKLEEHSDSLTFINKVPKENQFIWKKKIVFTPLDYRAVLVHTIQFLMSNIINVGKFTYLGKPFNEIHFVGNNPNTFYKMAKTDNELGLSVESYSVELK